MSISIKSADQIDKMRVAGKLASSVLEMIGDHVKTGVTTEKLDQICHDFIVNKLDSIPAPLNYNGFPKSICTSVNNVCLLYTSPRPRDQRGSRMPSSA